MQQGVLKVGECVCMRERECVYYMCLCVYVQTSYHAACSVFVLCLTMLYKYAIISLALTYTIVERGRCCSPWSNLLQEAKMKGLKHQHCVTSFLSPLGPAGNASLLTGKPVVVRFPDLLYKCKKNRYRRR